MGAAEAKAAIIANKTALGIEFGSTRIKAVLVDDKNQPIASGAHEWENRYENGVWTYSLDDIWTGIQDCYQDMAKDVKAKYDIELESVGAFGVSAMIDMDICHLTKKENFLYHSVHGETTLQEKPARN